MKAKELDEKFDNNENVLEYFDLTNIIRRPGWENQELNIEFPKWMIQAIEREARRLGVNSFNPCRIKGLTLMGKSGIFCGYLYT